MTLIEMRAALAAAGVDAAGLTDAEVVQRYAELAGALSTASPSDEVRPAGFGGHRRALTDGAFDAFGRAAEWGAGGPVVTVRIGGQDEDDPMDQARIRVRSTRLQVRRWGVSAPAAGDLVRLLETEIEPEMVLVVHGRPWADRRGVWQCAAGAAA